MLSPRLPCNALALCGLRLCCQAGTAEPLLQDPGSCPGVWTPVCTARSGPRAAAGSRQEAAGEQPGGGCAAADGAPQKRPLLSPCSPGADASDPRGGTEGDGVGSEFLGSSPRAGATLGTDLLSLGSPRHSSHCWNKGRFSDSGLASCGHQTLCISTRDEPWL